jgi:PAS domain S-box-containing protein
LAIFLKRTFLLDFDLYVFYYVYTIKAPTKANSSLIIPFNHDGVYFSIANLVDIKQKWNSFSAKDSKMTNLTFVQLVDIEQIQHLLEAQYKITGVLSAILDTDENILAAAGWQDICTRFHRIHPVACERCRESDAYIKAYLPDFTGEYLDYKCKNGLRDVAMPIIIAGEHLATFFTGQFFYEDEKPDPEYFRGQALELGFDEEGYLDALSRVPVFTREQICNIVGYYRNLVQIMAEMGLQNLMLAQEVKERKQAEKEASFFRTIIENTCDSVYVIDPEDGWRMFYVNQAACSHFGMDREKLLTMRIPDWDPVFDVGNIDIIWQQKKLNKSMRFETLHRVASGELVPVEVTANELIHDGKELHAGYFYNISERKTMEAALRTSEQNLIEAQRIARVGNWVWDLSGNLLSASAECYRVFGMASTEVADAYNAFLMLVHPEDRDNVQAAFETFLKNHLPHSVEYRIISQDGTERIIHENGEVVFDALGTPVHAVGTVQDITERKKAEKQILRLNRLYAILSEVNQAIVRSTDQYSLFQEICRVVVKHGGFALAWIGIVDEESGIVKPAASNSIKEGYLDNIRVTVGDEPEGMGPTGSAIRRNKLQIVNDFLSNPRTSPWHKEAEKLGFNSVAAIPLKLNGKTIGALTMYGGEKHFFHGQMSGLLLQLAEDISFALENLDREARRKETERALQKEIVERLQAMEALHEKDQLLMHQSRQAAMGEMINNIAHQWRQPLNTVALTIQDLLVTYEEGECSCEYVDETVKQIMNQVLHMSQTIDDFRNFLKPDQEIKQFNLRETVKKTLILVGDSFKSQNIKTDAEAHEDLIVTGYQNEYCQVLLNILNNARDVLTERNIVSPRIKIKLFREGYRNVTTISDNAGGIPDAIIDRIFEPYFTTKDADKGTGIGLYMSKSIIEKRMNGKISVRNTDQGAEFRIEV